MTVSSWIALEVFRHLIKQTAIHYEIGTVYSQPLIIISCVEKTHGAEVLNAPKGVLNHPLLQQTGTRLADHLVSTQLRKCVKLRLQKQPVGVDLVQSGSLFDP